MLQHQTIFLNGKDFIDIGISLEKGMSVSFVSSSFINPILSDYPAVRGAFKRGYGVDVQSLQGCLHSLVEWERLD